MAGGKSKSTRVQSIFESDLNRKCCDVTFIDEIEKQTFLTRQTVIYPKCNNNHEIDELHSAVMFNG